MSSDLETALVEYSQDFPDRPGTFCRYDVNVDRIADLRDGATRAALGIAPSVLACPRKKNLLIDKTSPPTFPLVARCVRAGAPGGRVR